MTKPWANSPKGTMTAMVLSSPGAEPPPAAFSLDTKFPKPTLPNEEWVLVRVHAIGLNRGELRARQGFPPAPPEFGIFIEHFDPSPPQLLGEEFVGVVEVAGSQSGFSKGDIVTGLGGGLGKAFNGCYAQYVISHRRRTFRLPKDTSLSWNVLAAIPMAAVTAYGGLILSGGLERRPKGSTVLIHGATSSVGVFAVLLAKERGATVIATTRKAEKVKRLKEIGADHVIMEDDLDNEIRKSFPKGVDITLELVGPNQLLRSLRLAARFGVVVMLGVLNKVWEAEGFVPGMIPITRSLSFYTMSIDTGITGEDAGIEDLEGVMADFIRKVEKGEIAVDAFLDHEFTFEQLGEAHECMEESRATGKLVVSVP